MTLFIILIIALLVFIAVKQQFDEKKYLRECREETEKLFGNYPLFGKKHSEYVRLEELRQKRMDAKDGSCFELDEISSKDLEIESIHDLIDCCGSFYGEERLWNMLKNPSMDMEELKKREALITALYEAAEERLGLQLAFDEIGRDYKRGIRELTEGFEYSNEEEERAEKRALISDCVCLFMGILASVMIFGAPTAGFFIFLLVLFVNLITYFKRKKRINRLLEDYQGILRLLYAADKVCSIKAEGEIGERIGFIKKELEECRSLLSGSGLLLHLHNATGGALDLVFDYLRMFLHTDLIRFYFVRRKAGLAKGQLWRLSDMVGEVDAAIAAASFRKRMEGNWCRPEFTQDKRLQIEELWHPLLEHPVKNSIDIEGGMLLTGSNASGKSTFLRAAGLSIVLAQSIMTVPAKKYRFHLTDVKSSMNLSDDIHIGASYYMAEIKSLKRILDEANCGKPLFCAIDEVLKGTNTAERIAASGEILRYLRKYPNVTCFVATHDLELLDLLKGEYEPYYFLEDIEEESEGVKFSYKINKGKSDKRNAIRLLRAYGYPEEITSAAQSICSEYLSRGDYA